MIDDPSQPTPVTMWVIGDLDSPEGFRIVKDALKHLSSDKCATRLGFIHVPSAEIMVGGPEMSTTLHLLMSALPKFHPAVLLKLIERLEENPTGTGPDPTATSEAQVPIDMMQDAGVEAIASPGSHEDLEASYTIYADAGTEIARQLGIIGSAPHLLVNGRVSHQSPLELIHSSWDHYPPVHSPRKTLPFSRRTSTANVSSQSSICSRQCTTIFPSLTVRHLQIWWRASRRS